MFPISFGSDNHSGVHPAIMEALVKANHGYCPAYGDDPLTQDALAAIRELFGGDCEAWFVMTGTGANVIALQSLISSWHAVACPVSAHINVDECGAVQKFTQARLQPIETPDGKLTPELIEPRLYGNRDQHHSQFRVISISQSTEYGSLYTPSEITALADFAHRRDMYLHIDGARLANAAAALDCSLASITKDAGADIISFGGTKNGLLFGEAVVSFRPELTGAMRFYRKQATQLYSKMRFIGAQFLAYLYDDLWKSNALHANRMCALLGESLSGLDQVKITMPPVVNALFCIPPKALTQPLMDKYHFYMWNEALNEVRLMCGFDTREEHIDAFVKDLL